MSEQSPEAEVQNMRSDLGGGDSQEASGLQLVDPSIQDANPWESDLDQVCCKLQWKKKNPVRIPPPGNCQNCQWFIIIAQPAFTFFFIQNSMQVLSNAHVCSFTPNPAPHALLQLNFLSVSFCLSWLGAISPKAFSCFCITNQTDGLHQTVHLTCQKTSDKASHILSMLC